MNGAVLPAASVVAVHAGGRGAWDALGVGFCRRVRFFCCCCAVLSAPCGVGDGSPHPHPPHPQPVGSGPRPHARKNELSGVGKRPTPDAPHQGKRRPPPPPPPGTLSAQISATTKRGCRPWAGSSRGPGNRGADLLLPPPPPTEMGPDRKQAQHPPPPPRMPSHPHCRPSHGDPGPSGSGRRATSMLGSGTRMVTQQVVLLSHASEQVDPSTTLPPPPPSLRPRREGCTESAPSGPKKWRL